MPRNTAKVGMYSYGAEALLYLFLVRTTSVIGPPARQELGRCRIACNSWNMAKQPCVCTKLLQQLL